MDPILVPTDLSSRSDRAVMRAAHLATLLGANLHVLHVADDDLPPGLADRRAQEAEALLDRMIEGDARLSEMKPKISVMTGDVAPVVARVAAERSVGLVVLGSHRNRGVGELLGEPTLSRILRAVRTPVLVAVGGPEKDYRRVIVGWDGSPASYRAFELTRTIAPDASVELLGAWHEPFIAGPYGMVAVSDSGSKELRGQIADAAETLSTDGHRVTAEVLVGGPGEVLLRQAHDEEADLMAVGRHARSGLTRFLMGDTARNVALYGACDVLVAPPT